MSTCLIFHDCTTEWSTLHIQELMRPAFQQLARKEVIPVIQWEVVRYSESIFSGDYLATPMYLPNYKITSTFDALFSIAALQEEVYFKWKNHLQEGDYLYIGIIFYFNRRGKRINCISNTAAYSYELQNNHWIEKMPSLGPNLEKTIHKGIITFSSKTEFHV